MTFTYDVELAPDVAAAVWARLDSTCEYDRERRAVLRADRDALTDGDPLRRLYNGFLGDDDTE